MDTEEDMSLALNNLIKGITMHNVQEQMRWHKVLYHIGKPAFPKIEAKLVTFTTSELSRHLKLLYLSGLMQLARDIDEQAAQDLAQQLIRNSRDKLIANRLKTIIEFTLENYVRYTIRGISIFVDKNIRTLYPIRLRLTTWFQQIPDDDLKNIERVYIVNQKPKEHLGQYTPIFYNIKLVWHNPFSWYNPLLWIFLWVIWFMREKTFYHEVGHHAHHHTFGQDPDQEQEANSYAADMLAKRHSIIYTILHVLRRVLTKYLPQNKGDVS